MGRRRRGAYGRDQRLVDGRYGDVSVFAHDERMRAEPFAETEIALADPWVR